RARTRTPWTSCSGTSATYARGSEGGASTPKPTRSTPPLSSGPARSDRGLLGAIGPGISCPPMAYRIDPELAEFLPLIPLRDWGDPVGARAAMNELVGALNGDVDTTGVRIE